MRIPVPAFFTTSAVRVIPFGARIILLPAPSRRGGDAALLDQAESGMRFSMLGGYAISIDWAGRVDSHATPDPVTELAAGPQPARMTCSS